ncbi:hypothetical protein [Flavobacterium beibuense]|uniref:hypothetical protein n=1 Tax=Flavobacterium beibuense TaxID=657326 RepID=UPI003A91931D
MSNSNNEKTSPIRNDVKKWIAIAKEIIANPNSVYYYEKGGINYKVDYTITDYPEHGKREINMTCHELNSNRIVSVDIESFT